LLALLEPCLPCRATMAKKKKKKDSTSSSSSEEKDKKKKKKDSKKKVKDDKVKSKKDKKKDKKKGKTKSSSSGSSDVAAVEVSKASVDASGEPPSKASRGSKATPQMALPPPEEGILRFEFTADEDGPLGVRFSGGFPPMILTVNPDTHASRKGIPINHSVHAVNGLPMVEQNTAHVMHGLKSRPVTLDVRPQGWKPPAVMQELARRKALADAQKSVRVDVEMQRREQVAQEKKEAEKRDAAERIEQTERKRQEQEAALQRARQKRERQKAAEEDWEKRLAEDGEDLRHAANELMAADYGTTVKADGRRGLPLRLLTRQEDVAWVWCGEVQELIGGGVQDSDWSE